MDAFVIVALAGVALLIAELLLPTGGVLASIGAAGMVAGGVIALTTDSESSAADIAGPALITLGILSIITFFFVGRKVLEAHRDEPVRTGSEELIGASAEARTTLDPKGQVFVEGAIWAARLVGDGAPRPGDRVRIEAIDGLTLLVSPEAKAPEEEGAT
jgi:membrane-bound serine protease (ClpP class)